MANLTLRLVKGSPLTYAEVDNNFTALNDSTGHFKNVLINGNFDFWQRGTSFTNSPAYGADRWTHDDGDGTHTTSRQAFTLGQTDVPNEPRFFWRHNRTSASTVLNNVIRQAIESVRTFAGQTITWSFWAKVGSGTKSLVPVARQGFGTGGSPSANNDEVATAITITTSWQKFSITFALDSISGKTLGTAGDDSLSILLREASGFSTFTLDFAQAQVEKGSLATEFERRPLGTELALCQRYFFKTFPQGTDPAQNVGVTGSNEGVAASNGNFRLFGEFPVLMRDSPTTITYNPSAANSSARNITDGTDVGIVIGATDRRFSVAPNPIDSADANDVINLHLTADAEL